MSGTLTAEREGPHIKLAMEFADGEDHIFVTERYDGTVTDTDGNETEIWTPIHTGQAKFVEGDVDYELGGVQDGPDGPVVVNLPSPRRYRAEAYRRVEIEFGPNVKRSYLQGQGNRTAVVTI